MSDTTRIAWTDATWNPVSGCSHASPGCDHCYAEALSRRFRWTAKPWTAANARENVTLHPERLTIPLRWRRPRRIFVASMGDLFHPQVPDEFIDRVWGVMASAQRHTFQVLTKRPERLVSWFGQTNVLGGGDFLPNVWLGVTAEDQRRADERIPLLLQVPAAVRLVSCEPLLGPITLPIPLDWVIVGCESGPSARLPDMDWVRDLRDQCQTYDVPLFVKQLMVGGKVDHEPVLDGRIVRQFPRGTP